MTGFEIGALIIGGVHAGISGAQAWIVYKGIKSMEQEGKRRSVLHDQRHQQTMDDQQKRHDEAMAAHQRQHEQAMKALEELIRRTAPRPPKADRPVAAVRRGERRRILRNLRNISLRASVGGVAGGRPLMEFADSPLPPHAAGSRGGAGAGGDDLEPPSRDGRPGSRVPRGTGENPG